jgi:hypothetical protein
MRLTTLAILLPFAITTAFPIAPAMVQIIQPHSPRNAKAVAEAIVDPPHYNGAVNVPLPPRNAIAPAMVFILPQSEQHPNQHSPRAAEAVVDPPPHHSGAVNVPLPSRNFFERIALALVKRHKCPSGSAPRPCHHGDTSPHHAPDWYHAPQPSAQPSAPDDTRGVTMYKTPDLKGESTFIPVNRKCTEMTNISGGFNNNVHSLIVDKGVLCEFYK